MNGVFLTLTYANAPEIGDYADFQAFLKRLHRREEHHFGTRTIRYLSVGEYGHKTGRFHFHSLLWNTPPLLEEWLTGLWPHGFWKAGTVTPASVRYTARYTLKFAHKGQEAVAGWSKKPPLGGPGIRCVARRMADDPKGRYKVERNNPPRMIQLQGKSWPLSRTLRREFMREYLAEPDWEENSSACTAHLNYQINMRLGDPVAAQRKRQHDRAHFWEKARFSFGEF